MNLSKKALELERERSEPPIETHHEQRVADQWLLFVDPHDVTQLIFIQAQRLFAENVLTGRQCCQHLSRMQMMTRSNDHGVDARIADEALFIGGTVAKSELLRGVIGMGAVGSAHTGQGHTTNSFYCRQQRTSGEIT